MGSVALPSRGCGCVCACVCPRMCVHVYRGLWQAEGQGGVAGSPLLKTFCPNSAKRRKPWHPSPRPLPHSPWLPGASMSTHPSLPTCSPEPRALRSALSLPALPSPPSEGYLLPPSLPCGVGTGKEGRRRAAHPSADQQSTPHQEGGRWLKPKSLN